MSLRFHSKLYASTCMALRFHSKLYAYTALRFNSKLYASTALRFQSKLYASTTLRFYYILPYLIQMKTNSPGAQNLVFTLIAK